MAPTHQYPGETGFCARVEARAKRALTFFFSLATPRVDPAARVPLQVNGVCKRKRTSPFQDLMPLKRTRMQDSSSPPSTPTPTSKARKGKGTALANRW